MSREYSAFLLRLWRNQSDQPWRASLQDAKSGERKHFADLAQLMAYLEQHGTTDDEIPANIVEWIFSN